MLDNGIIEISTGGSGGGGGASYWPDAPPKFPSAWDDEFNSATPSGLWTNCTTYAQVGTVLAGTAHVTSANTTRFPGWFQSTLNSVASDTWWAMTEPFAPGNVAYSVTVKVGMWVYRNTYFTLFINNGVSGAADGVEAKFGGASFNFAPQVIFASTDSGTETSRYSYVPGNSHQNYPAFDGNVFLHLQCDTSSNWTMWVSSNGVSWVNVMNPTTVNNVSTTYSKVFTATQIVLNHDIASEGVQSQCAIDWIRVNWLTLP